MKSATYCTGQLVPRLLHFSGLNARIFLHINRGFSRRCNQPAAACHMTDTAARGIVSVCLITTRSRMQQYFFVINFKQSLITSVCMCVPYIFTKRHLLAHRGCLVFTLIKLLYIYAHVRNARRTCIRFRLADKDAWRLCVIGGRAVCIELLLGNLGFR